MAVFLGCSFSQQKESELRDRINKLVAEPHAPLVVVSGCHLSTCQQHPKIHYARTPDVPKVIGEYLKKSGRTGRNGNRSVSILPPPKPSPIISI